MKKQVTFYLDERSQVKLNVVAAFENTSVSSILSCLIDDFLSNYEVDIGKKKGEKKK